MTVSITATTALDDAQRAEIRALARTVEQRDGQPPLSDQALTQLSSSEARHVLAIDADRVVGYAQLEGAGAELFAAAPDSLDPLLAATEADAPADLLVWSHGTRSTLAATLDGHGYRRARVLHQLRRPLTEPVDVAPAAAGVDIRAFVPGQDEDAWLRVNAAAFAHHPEQGGWTRADLEARESESWFDPAGFLLAQREGAVIGFHWTKLHGAGVGEVYVLGVDPSAQGLGLGATLLTRGLAYLADQGCRLVLLYVDESNDTAMRLYLKSGFETYDTDVQWARR